MDFSLTELEAQFFCYENGGKSWRPVETLAEAHGLRFLCPKCFETNKGRVGTHAVMCWFEDRVPDSAVPSPGRWNPVGTGLSDITFVPGLKSKSVQINGGCNAHFFVAGGRTTP